MLRSALQLIEDQLAMLLEYAEGTFERIDFASSETAARGERA
jgi:hypothetical protein